HASVAGDTRPHLDWDVEMIHIRACTNGVCRMEAPIELLPSLLEDGRTLLWVDLEAPTPEEISHVGEGFGWHLLLVEDLIPQGQRAKLDSFGDHLFLVMHAISYEGTPPQLSSFEVDLVAGPRYVVSSHPHPIPHITEHRDQPERAERTLGDDRDHLLW